MQLQENTVQHTQTQTNSVEKMDENNKQRKTPWLASHNVLEAEKGETSVIHGITRIIK